MLRSRASTRQCFRPANSTERGPRYPHSSQTWNNSLTWPLHCHGASTRESYCAQTLRMVECSTPSRYGMKMWSEFLEIRLRSRFGIAALASDPLCAIALHGYRVASHFARHERSGNLSPVTRLTFGGRRSDTA